LCMRSIDPYNEESAAIACTDQTAVSQSRGDTTVDCGRCALP
jgi:hypothetical protein